MEQEVWINLKKSKLRNIGGNNGIVKKVYGLNGKYFPRLVLSVYSYKEGFKVCCSRKKKGGSFWEPSLIPESLINETISLLEQARKEMDNE